MWDQDIVRPINKFIECSKSIKYVTTKISALLIMQL